PTRHPTGTDWCARVFDFSVDPKHEGTVYAAGCEGVWKTKNGGATWMRVYRSESMLAVAVDPVTPSTVYGGGTGSMVRSLDGGLTWSAFDRGLYADQVDAIAVDSVAGGTVHVATPNSGVFDFTSG